VITLTSFWALLLDSDSASYPHLKQSMVYTEKKILSYPLLGIL
jgi:hypothetical protein